MNVRYGLPLVIGTALLMAACQPQAPADLSDEDEAVVRGIFDTSLASIRAADWAAWAALFSDDAVFHPPHEPALRGREAIQQWAEAYPPIEAVDFQDVQIGGAGNVAYGTSSYTLTVTGAPADTGKQLAVLQRDPSGKWEVVAVSFNSDLPLPAPSEPPATPAT